MSYTISCTRGVIIKYPVTHTPVIGFLPTSAVVVVTAYMCETLWRTWVFLNFLPLTPSHIFLDHFFSIFISSTAVSILSFSNHITRFSASEIIKVITSQMLQEKNGKRLGKYATKVPLRTAQKNFTNDFTPSTLFLFIQNRWTCNIYALYLTISLLFSIAVKWEVKKQINSFSNQLIRIVYIFTNFT